MSFFSYKKEDLAGLVSLYATMTATFLLQPQCLTESVKAQILGGREREKTPSSGKANCIFIVAAVSFLDLKMKNP